jgi:integrase
MAVMKRGGNWYIYFRPFKDRKIGVKLDVTGKTEAKGIEAMLTRACRTGDYTGLDQVTREVCVRMFLNQRWELPPELGGTVAEPPKEELTLWRACERFLKYPEIKSSPGRWRYEIALAHLVEKIGQDFPLKSLWVPRLREYQLERKEEGAAADTINRELGVLSKLFTVMTELQLVESNPCRMVGRLSAISGQREVYLSRATVQQIADHCPAWYVPMLWTAYYTGMRRGEILGLTRKQMNLGSRVIVITPDGTKEHAWKRIPVHTELVPILREVLEGPALMNGNLFPLRDGRGINELGVETFKNVWPRACESLRMEEPLPRFHDLRHTWKTNARRSGIHPEIEMAIMGHSQRRRSVHERYGRISDQELLAAIDRMTFDHGETEIFVYRDPRKGSGENGNR